MLIQFTSALGGTLLPALLIMVLSAILKVGEGREKPKSSPWRLAGVLLGLAGAVVFAALRGTGVLKQRAVVVIPALQATCVLDVLAIIAVVCSLKVVPKWSDHRVAMAFVNLFAALDIAMTLFRSMPTVILQLTDFYAEGDPVFTSESLVRALGFCLGIGAAVATACILSMTRTSVRRGPLTLTAALLIALALAEHARDLVTNLVSVRRIQVHGAAFQTLAWFNNHSTQLTLAQLFVFLIPVALSVVSGIRMPSDLVSFQSGIPRADLVDRDGARSQEASARRVYRKFRRRTFEAVAFSLVAMIGVTVALTYGVAMTRQVITLSEPEEYQLTDTTATITYEQVADGHLHRFQYTAKDGTVMRFIVIRKSANGNAYGIGLDACENCGDAGYYEKDGKIICKRCDVAINLATIGFKGGCNPIPFPYESTNGAIVIQTADLDALSAHFR